MHLLLVGPGALGCLLSTVISRGLGGDDRLTILDYNADRASYLTGRGIVCYSGGNGESVPVTVISAPWQLDRVDVVLLCVKSYDVVASLEFCKHFLSSQTLLIFLQNGIGHLEIADHLCDVTAAFATTTEGATLVKKGHVRHAGSGCTSFGFLVSPPRYHSNLLQRTHYIFAAGGLEVQLVDDILARLWAKLFINVGINALTAILDCKNGALLTVSGPNSRLLAAIDEAVRIARAKKIAIIDDPYQATRTVCSRTAENFSSMLQDVRNKKRTEIGAINGAIVSLGKDLGIDTPENTLLCQQVYELEAGYT